MHPTRTPFRWLAASALLASGLGTAQTLTVIPAAPQYMEPVYLRVSPEPGAKELVYGAQASMSGPFNDVFATWMVYGTDGKPTWYLLGGGKWTSANATTTYEGKVFKTSGPHFGQLFESRKVGYLAVGTAKLEFRDAMTGVFRFDVEGVSGLKNITRMPVE